LSFEEEIVNYPPHPPHKKEKKKKKERSCDSRRKKK
jgi:hypothetical protein